MEFQLWPQLPRLHRESRHEDKINVLTPAGFLLDVAAEHLRERAVARLAVIDIKQFYNRR